MKSKILIGAIVALTAFTFASCKKCSTCTYTNQFNETITTNETCAGKDDLDTFEQDMETTWGEYGEVTCTR